MNTAHHPPVRWGLARTGACRQALAGALASVLLAGPAAATGKPAAAPAPPAPQQGVVTRVIDGDTVLLAQPGQAPVTVRLRDIDAPEICQVWGEQARQALSEMVLNKPVALQPAGRDGNGRLVAGVRVEGVDISARMVEEGHAWSIRTRYDRGPLVKQERVAQALDRGLHADGKAMLPRDFRRAHGPCKAP